MNMQVLDSRRDASGGYKVDVSRGQRIGRVSSEWFSRPDDERFLSLGDLARSVRGRSERSRTRVVESADQDYIPFGPIPGAEFKVLVADERPDDLDGDFGIGPAGEAGDRLRVELRPAHRHEQPAVARQPGERRVDKSERVRLAPGGHILHGGLALRPTSSAARPEAGRHSHTITT